MTRILSALGVFIFSVHWGCAGVSARRTVKVETFDAAKIQIQLDSAEKNACFLLPAGVIRLSKPLIIRGGAIRCIQGQAGTVLAMSKTFAGRAGIELNHASSILLEGFEVAGNRPDLPHSVEMAPHDKTFLEHFSNNGMAVEKSNLVKVSRVSFRDIHGFGVIVSGSDGVVLEELTVRDSGSRNSLNRNNTSGGILIEEGTSNFEVLRCDLRGVIGNGIWTHSRSSSPRNSKGRISGNRVEETARDAFQAGHATEIEISNNRGTRIGFPPELVDIEHSAVPVGIDTAGNVDKSSYISNTFQDVNGTCINLDGFHDGTVGSNSCTNREDLSFYPHLHFGIVLDNSNPGMESRRIRIIKNVTDGTAYGGLYLIGREHTVEGNEFRRVNRARCTGNPGTAMCNYDLATPGLLRSGIFLAAGANRPDAAAGNRIVGNVVEGYQMTKWCIGAAASVKAETNQIERNTCTDESR